MQPEIVFMNPPRGSKRRKTRRKAKRAARARRRFSAAQRRAQAAFARMAKARAKHRRPSRKTRRRSKAKTIRPQVIVSNPPRRTTRMARKTRRRGSRRRSTGGGFSRRGFALNPFHKDMLPDAIGIAAAAIGAPLIAQKLAGRFVMNADGTVNPNKYMLAKVIAGGGLSIAAKMAGQGRLARGLAIGTLGVAAVDLIQRAMPQFAPASTALARTGAAAGQVATVAGYIQGDELGAYDEIEGYVRDDERMAVYG